ncbi:hypothetical protein EN943_32520 [Mesorhizobium sp. M7A.F.Ca.US.006.01.1.1]|uniref:M15 family metallopeptidase n=1 Tax=Mesorhizobium sp. M7A.F.Ca.US.006.01.1.1 TaxID=2496707 RepID=UPI000FC9B118|nr:M15 family metallopeptidase [Mesorhizobium sp. M7A.F.Ca.US.006.01.1.1]RUZ71810.1 hypothetical protein EN943_32520 [Mesorhizobium sp. M7A.F.Ca.US.006.01.1.1]
MVTLPRRCAWPSSWAGNATRPSKVISDSGSSSASPKGKTRTPSLSGEALKEAAHRFSAVPEVAGHPTGGAVDVRIIQSNGQALAMGTELGEDCPDTYVFSPFIKREHWRNRQTLRFCMLRAGFAPFDGEWWHFSFGDREWARYFDKDRAIYSQLSFSMDKGAETTSR